nr:hypothetical protein [Wolbachia endosymbiont of Oedothorax gibbosus]
MPRHWDPEKLIVNKRLYNIFNKITKKLDSSVTHWNDIIYYATSCHIATFVQLCTVSHQLTSSGMTVFQIVVSHFGYILNYLIDKLSKSNFCFG